MATRRFYTSSNGDTWDLVRDGNQVRVRHQPNAASGGNTTDYELATFLGQNWRQAQADALVDLIGTLVDNAEGMAT